MPLIAITNDKLFLEISPEMGASITKFQNLKSKKNIFRPFSNKKKSSKKIVTLRAILQQCHILGQFKRNHFYIKINLFHCQKPIHLNLIQFMARAG